MNGSIAAALRGTGCYVPERVVPNDWFTKHVDTSDEWIRTRTGIRERRFVGPEESSSTLGVAAAKSALIAAGLTANDLDLIICATVTPDHMCPSNACLIQAGLGCRPIPAFDISAACTAFLYAMSIAEQFLRNGAARHVLVVGTDVLSRTIDLTDRNTCILFGDGAGAVILSAADTQDRGIRSIKLFADGAAARLIHVPGMVTVQPPAGEKQHEHIWLNGREVFKFAVRRMIELTQTALREAREMGVEIDLLIPHQVNQRIIDAALETTGFPSDRVMVNLAKYGNTSAASVPIALDEALREGRAKPGDTILLVAFGGGLTWGSAIVTL
jgi:3-oxoacyl-[acyl-carrier-protein] synthase III